MNSYKGISLNNNTKIRSWIDLYHKEEHDLREAYMESDRTLQKYVRNHHLEITLYKIAFNLGIYAMFYGVYILTKG